MHIPSKPRGCQTKPLPQTSILQQQKESLKRALHAILADASSNNKHFESWKSQDFGGFPDWKRVKASINSGIREVSEILHVEYLRSANGADSWHHRNAYQHAPQGVEGFIHDLYRGQIASFFA